MPQTVRSDSIKFRNSEFAIAHHIDDCPPPTVVRELVKNAEENASMISPPGRIEWFEEIIDGVPKLGLFNEGPGMSDEDLDEFMDMASTGKKLGVQDNFGQGGKLSALKVSPHGVRYRSCKNGRVCEIVIAAENRPGVDYPVYVKQRQEIFDDEGGHWDAVIDVTEEYANRDDRPLTKDWTEVVLYGTGPSSDTLHALVPDQKSVNWLMKLVNARFYRFGEGIVVRACNITTGQPNSRNAFGLGKHTDDFTERNEVVEVDHEEFGKIKINYCKLQGEWSNSGGKGRSRGTTMEACGIGTRGDHVCLVWKNECYDMRTGWSRISGAFGFMFGSANIAIQIFLPEKAQIKNNTYRDQIITKGRDHQTITVDQFAEIVQANRPQWIVDYVEQQSRQATDNSNLQQRLRDYLDLLQAKPEPRDEVHKTGNDQGERVNRVEINPSPTQKDKTDRRSSSPRDKAKNPGTGKRLPSKQPGIPNISFTDDPAILDEIKGRAAVYKKEGNMVLLNPTYYRYVEDLNKVCNSVGGEADMRAAAKREFDDNYCMNAGRFVIQVWLSRGRPEFTEEDFEQALSIGTLTACLTSPSSLDETLRILNRNGSTRKSRGDAK